MNKKISIASLLVALGIVYGDIGTSPLYVMKSMLGVNNGYVSKDLILGGVSLVIWTLTLQTTIKYVMLTLEADNKGEGGIFSLYTLVRKNAKWLIGPAVIGGATLLADGMITPPVTVTSAIEGLTLVFPIETRSIIIIVISILTVLFLLQRFGTDIIGKVFGPMMVIWFSMLLILGFTQILQYTEIVRAINPYYGIKLLVTSPQSVYILGAVFLCTTGAEALYSDLGHCGKRNIHYTWIFVKISLVINYLGQGAWLMLREGSIIKDNPFFLIMPSWFVIPGTIIATIAAIIASQALITGSFTLVSEAIKLNLFPKLQVRYPNDDKGKIYIPAVNYLLYIGCVLLVLKFQKSENMEAAYGLAITITMIMTTILLSQYLRFNKQKKVMSILIFVIFMVIESAFLYANLFKFVNGGYVTIVIAGALIFLMYIWIYGTVIRKRFNQYVNIFSYEKHFKSLKEDKELPLYATNLVYLTESQNYKEVERKIAFSLFNKQPKRAKYYWFINVRVTDEPYTKEYSVKTIVPNEAFSIQFNLGFRIDQKINVFLYQVIQELACSGEVKFTPKEYMISNNNKCVVGDFKFVLLEEILSNESELSRWDSFITSVKLLIKKLTVSPAKWFGIDTSNVEVEKVPIIVGKKEALTLTRIS
ncbi:KUP/HAK/KT family potassium transporter [Clostridium hydrogeniformans]|uniref:KUP/HAK/KT family potassium transporter n=1 Tax=Clostridium hydrogeniformans TaxID=349933 RepID=UPI000481B3B2|nr:KUP/HAK/KT family potassium transporter [Clostridium hydrogeniformans]